MVAVFTVAAEDGAFGVVVVVAFFDLTDDGVADRVGVIVFFRIIVVGTEPFCIWLLLTTSAVS